MTTAQISKTLSQLGWELEADLEHKPLPAVRAKCGGFYTPYRALAESVLNDVLMVKSSRPEIKNPNAAVIQAFPKGRWT